MKYKSVFITLGIALLFLLGFFLYSLDWDKQEIEVGFHADVSKDSFTMAQRLLAEHNVQWQTIKQLDKNNQQRLTSNQNSVLFVDEATLSIAYELDQQLPNWVANGGHLVYILNKQRDELGLDNTTFFQNLGITINTQENVFENHFAMTKEGKKNTTLKLKNHMQLDLELSHAFSIKNCPGIETKNNEDQVVMCEFSFGDGRIIVMPSMSPFINYQLRHLDHGSLLVWLSQGADIINYIPYLRYPNWFARLWQWSWQWVMSVIVLVIVFTWHLSSRVGRAYAPDSRQIVSFALHIRAVAHYYTRHGFEQRLFTALKKDFQARAESRIPNFNVLSETQQIDMIAKLTKTDRQQVAELLSMQPSDSQQHQTDYIKRYKQLRNAL